MLKISTAAMLDTDVFPPDGLLKAESFQRLRSAEAIEVAARKKAAGYLRRARETARQIRKKARETGYAEGLLRFSQAVERLDAAQGDLQTRLEALLRQGLQGVLRRVPKEEWLTAILNDVAGELQAEPEIVVMTHPVNMRALAAAIASLKQRNPDLLPIRPESNPQMGRDECLVYAGLEVIDVGIPVVVEEMIAALKVVRPSGSNDEESAHDTEAEAEADLGR
jgi:Flagellar biosynthesis/type III secretory pathway protein